MDIIQEIIKTFSEKERNEFRNFLLRQKFSTKRKDLKLLDEIISSDGEVSLKKIKTPTIDSYHSLRKRLFRNLSDFIIVKEKSEDISEAGVITGWISLSKYFFRHGLTAPAWKYLLKAEQTALEAEQFELLVGVYLLMIEHIHENKNLNLDEILEKQRHAKILADESERMLISTALIRKRLDECKVNLTLDGFPEYVENTFDKYGLNEAILNRPSHLIHLLEIVRSTYLAMRELKNFEPFILEQYSRFNRIVSDKRHHHEYRLRFLYMIAHVFYRNRKFKQSLKFLDQLASEMQEYNGFYYDKFYPKYISLVSFIKSFSGDNDSAIQIHEKILGNKKRKLETRTELNMKLNLIFFYFNANQYKKANSVFLKFEHSDSYYGKIMGKEWVLRKKIIQLIVHYELGNEDESIFILNQIEKDLGDLLSLTQYQKAANFLLLLRNYIKDPYSLNFKQYREIAGKELFMTNPEEEESKAIAFYCWMKSKLTDKDYYKTLLEEVQRV